MKRASTHECRQLEELLPMKIVSTDEDNLYSWTYTHEDNFYPWRNILPMNTTSTLEGSFYPWSKLLPMKETSSHETMKITYTHKDNFYPWRKLLPMKTISTHEGHFYPWRQLLPMKAVSNRLSTWWSPILYSIHEDNIYPWRQLLKYEDQLTLSTGMLPVLSIFVRAEHTDRAVHLSVYPKYHWQVEMIKEMAWQKCKWFLMKAF